MSVSIHPNHTSIRVPQWRHYEARSELGMTVPPMTGLTLSDGTDYDMVLPDSVWRTIAEDLTEHFVKADRAKVDEYERRMDAVIGDLKADES